MGLAASAQPPTFDVAGNTPQSVAVGDFNGDGSQDLATANAGSANVSVLLGNGAGGFAPPTSFNAGAQPRSVAVGDFNGDGMLDLVAANENSANVSVLLGNGLGGFATPLISTPAQILTRWQSALSTATARRTSR